MTVHVYRYILTLIFIMVACPRCGETFSTMHHVIAHIGRIHSNEAHFRVVCNLQKMQGTCYSVFRSFASYKTHIYRYHSYVLAKPAGETQSLVTEILCCVCNSTYPSLRALTSHYRDHCNHGLSVPCIVKRCNKVFDVLSTYTAHMSRRHRNVSLLNIRDDFKCQKAVTVLTGDNEMCPMDIEEDQDSSRQSSESTDVCKNIALLFLKMKAQYCLADTTVQAIVNDFSDLCYLSSLTVEKHIDTLCAKYNLPVAEFRDAADSGSWKNAMTDLQSDSRRSAYYMRVFPYIMPTEYKFSDDCRNTDSFQYISVIDTLKAVLKIDDVRTQILNPETSAEGHLKSFRDGTLYQNHPVFSQTHYGVEIIVYSDEFQIVNPLGPHRKKHKLMAFYFTLGNFHSTCKSQKSCTFLLALCKSIHINKYGFGPIASHFNEEMHVLENSGITVDGYAHEIRGALAFIAGDNLNSHMIGGYNACFSPNVLYPCRFCLTTNSEMQETFTVDEMSLRTRESYNQHVSAMHQNGTESSFGIRCKSSFISGSFHVVDGLPPDIMHDLLEGVVPFEMALVLQYFVSEGYFTVEELNSILDSWKYGPLDNANKPVPISHTIGDSIKQNAGRMWCLLRLFPLMVAHKVPVGDEYWQFLLDLKDIVELVFSPRLAIGHVLMLQTKIQDHVQSYRRLFPSRLLKPKQHFMLHYARSMFVYGPLRKCWCMRFEAKHYYFARLMRVVNNFKHTCKSLAERHQMSLAYLLASNSLFQENDMSVSKTVDIDINFMSESVVDLLRSQSTISMSQTLHQCRFLKVNGIAYHCNMYVVLDVVNESPVFGQIEAIYVQNMNSVFLLKKCMSEYDAHLSAYRIYATDSIAMSSVEELLDYYPLSGYIVGLQRVVVLKNFVYNGRDFDY